MIDLLTLFEHFGYQSREEQRQKKIFIIIIIIIIIIIMNQTHFLLFFSMFTITIGESPTMLLSTAIRLTKIAVSYPTGVISERDLTVCGERSACNIIHRRFWLPPVIERLCRCPHRNECPWSWSDGLNQTISINNRSQLKFCSEVTNLPDCTQKKSAITIWTILPEQSNLTKNHTALQNSDKSKRQSQHRNITITCNCQETHYWKLKVNSSKFNQDTNLSQQSYYCSKLKKCARYDFCGYVRLDTHSTFYRCSCPKGHMCITRDKITYRAEEILYIGDSYKAYCLPHKIKTSILS